MKKRLAIIYGSFFAVLLLGLVLPVWPTNRPQLFIRFSPAEGANTAFRKVESNFTSIWPNSFATNQAYTLSPGFRFHRWTGVAVRATNYLPSASVGSVSNVVWFVIADEGRNAIATNITYETQPGDYFVGSVTQVVFTSSSQALRVYSAGGTNWNYW